MVTAPSGREAPQHRHGVHRSLMVVTDIGGSVTVQVAMALGILGSLLVGMAWPLLGPRALRRLSRSLVRSGRGRPATASGS